MLKKKFILITFILFSVFTLVGCKSDSSLTAFQENMQTFSDTIVSLDQTMNNIEPTSENAVNDLLECLDSMKEQFTLLAEMEVPDEFASIESLADEAGSYMTEAVDLYHEVFTTTPYDEYNAMLADESYKRAMKRKQYISQILQGEMPTGDDITAIYDDDDEKSAPVETTQTEDTAEAGTDLLED